MHSYYSTTYFYVKTSYFDFINLAVGQRMKEIWQFGFLVTDSESLTQYSNFWGLSSIICIFGQSSSPIEVQI